MKVKLRRNENGNALLIVLMVVVVFTILGVSLLSMNATASKQFDKKEEQVQARHQAEMGVLHYKAEVGEMLVAHNEELIKIKDKATKREDLEISLNTKNEEFCSSLAEKQTTSNRPTFEGSKSYTVHLSEKTGVAIDLGCIYDEDSKIIQLTVNSVGKAGISGEAEINANLMITLPESDFTVIGEEDNGIGSGNGEDGLPPTPPIGSKEVNIWPCPDQKCNEKAEKIINDFVNVDVIDSQKGNITVKNHLKANNINAGNGKGLMLTVAGDFYVKDTMNSGTHSCFAIQGNFTVINEIHTKNETYIFVYGDAYLPPNITKKGGHGEIFVLGDVYQNGDKKDPKGYRSFNPEYTKFKGCTLPGPRNHGNGSESDYRIHTWDLREQIESTYVR